MDITHGLLVEVEILCKERLLVQRLDYLHVPFRCSRCHDTGHLQRTCPLLLNSLSCSSKDGTPVSHCPSSTFAPAHPKMGNYSQALSLFEDVSNSLLEAINEMDSAPILDCHPDCVNLEAPVLDSLAEIPSLSPPCSLDSFPSAPLPLDSSPLPNPSIPSVLSHEDFPPLPPHASPLPLIPSPHSPVSSPSFFYPLLQRSLSIFSATTPSSPITLHRNSI